MVPLLAFGGEAGRGQQRDQLRHAYVFLDGEDWRELAIENPRGRLIFAVKGKEGGNQTITASSFVL